MSLAFQSFIGFGYVVSEVENEDMFAGIDDFRQWWDNLREWDYHYPFYDDTYSFFWGIIEVEADRPCYTSLENFEVKVIGTEEWKACEEEFRKIFPNHNLKPHWYLFNRVW